MQEVQRLLAAASYYADFAFHLDSETVNVSYYYVLAISNYTEVEAAKIVEINFYWGFIYQILSYSWGSVSIVFSTIGWSGLLIECYVFANNKMQFQSPSFIYHKALLGNYK